jgi:hypothetical protein
MQFIDLVTHLPDDILTKTNRATNGSKDGKVGMPLLGDRVVEFGLGVAASPKSATRRRQAAPAAGPFP